MDLSTIVYIVGALAYALLRRQSKPKQVQSPNPGPVVFQPSKAPLPLPSDPSSAQPFPKSFEPPPPKTTPFRPLFQEGSQRFQVSDPRSPSKNTSPSKYSLSNELEVTSEFYDPPKPHHFPRPELNEWRRAIVLSAILEPRYDKGLHQ